MDTATQTITFSGLHGLQTGDTVTYQSDGNQAVGNLVNGDSYDVIVVNSDSIQLGTSFTGTPVLSTGLCPQGGIGGTNAAACVDTTDSEIVFNQAGDGNLHTGDEVFYTVPAGGSAVGGLLANHLYDVVVIDPTHIMLVDPTYSRIVVNVNGTNISGNAVQATNNFQPNDPVTYVAPDSPPLYTFSSADVGIEVDGSDNAVTTTDSNGNQVPVYDNDNTLYLPGQPFTTGEGVDLVANSSNLGLPSGEYWVIVVGPNQIELAATQCQATGTCISGHDSHGNPIYIPVQVLSLGQNPSAADAALVNSFYTPGYAPILGLTNGEVYYALNPSGTSFQLSLTPGGGAIALNGADSTLGGSQFLAEYAGLTSAGSGQQNLIEDINATGSGTQQFSGIPGSSGSDLGTTTGTIASGATPPAPVTVTSITLVSGLVSALAGGATIEVGGVTFTVASGGAAQGATTIPVVAQALTAPIDAGASITNPGAGAGAGVATATAAGSGGASSVTATGPPRPTTTPRSP